MLRVLVLTMALFFASAVVSSGLAGSAEEAAALRKQGEVVAAELDRAETQGYVVDYQRRLLREAEAHLEKPALVHPAEARIDFHALAKYKILLAKGSTIAMKLPMWARELKYVKAPRPNDREVAYVSVFDGGFRRWTWDGGHGIRPIPVAMDELDKWHAQGFRTINYVTACRTPISYVLMPHGEEWTDGEAQKYVSQYWHNGERWWGMSGRFDGYQSILADKLEFAARLGLDGIHLDDAYGNMYQLAPVFEKNPYFVVCPNGWGKLFMEDKSELRYNVLAMIEGSGTPYPGSWDGWFARLRQNTKQSYNIPMWGALNSDAVGNISDLAFASELATKMSDACGDDKDVPSDAALSFSRRFSDYLYGDFVDVYAPENVVKLDRPTLRSITNERTLLDGSKELIIHVLNMEVSKRDVKPARDIQIEVSPGDFPLPNPLVVTFLRPGAVAIELKYESAGGKISFKVPEVEVWGVAVVGTAVPPRVTLRRPALGVPVPLDRNVVAGESFEVTAQIEKRAPAERDFTLELNLPKGWKAKAAGETPAEKRFTIEVPKGIPEGPCAVTPIVRSDKSLAGWPLQLLVTKLVSLRLAPCWLDVPTRGKRQLALDVGNNLARPTDVSIQLGLPPGLQSSKSQFALKLKPFERQRVSFEVETTGVPEGVTFWNTLDVPIVAKTTAGGAAFDETLPLRLFLRPFDVYTRGVQPVIMHGYPNLRVPMGPANYVVGFNPKDKALGETIELAKKALDGGGLSVLWLASQDVAGNVKDLEAFVEAGGGLVYHGAPFVDRLCPVTGGGTQAEAKVLNIEQHRLTKLVYDAKKAFDGPFSRYQVKAKPGAEVLASFEDGSPAIIVWQKGKGRIAYIAGDLGVVSEERYDFRKRMEPVNLWHLTGIYYMLLEWAAAGTCLVDTQ
jgi:hypothetical protein